MPSEQPDAAASAILVTPKQPSSPVDTIDLDEKLN